MVNLTNASGISVKAYDYDAFGNEKDRVGSDPNPFRYCGEYFDVESGAYYLRARYYDPSVGRFTQEDTHWNTSNMIYGDEPQQIGEYEDPLSSIAHGPKVASITQSGNRYAYALNQPTLYRDPSGDLAILATIGMKALIGAAVSTAGYLFFSYALGKEITLKGALIAAGSGAICGAIAGIVPGTGYIGGLFTNGTAAEVRLAKGGLCAAVAGIAALANGADLSTAATSAGVAFGVAVVSDAVGPALPVAPTGADVAAVAIVETTIDASAAALDFVANAVVDTASSGGQNTVTPQPKDPQPAKSAEKKSAGGKPTQVVTVTVSIM